MRYEEFTIEGRNAVIEAYRAGRPIDKLFILDGCQDGPILTIKREAKAKQTPVKFVTKERLDQLSETGKHQGVIAMRRLTNMRLWKRFWTMPVKKAKHRFYFYWITSKIRTTSARLSEPPTWRAHTA